MNEYFRVFRAFSDANRVRILELLCKGEQCACVLLDDLAIGQPTLSHHMKILTESGIVKSRREGRWQHYSINDTGCDHARKLLDGLKRGDMSLLPRIAILLQRGLLLTRRLFAPERGRMKSANGCCCATVE